MHRKLSALLLAVILAGAILPMRGQAQRQEFATITSGTSGDVDVAYPALAYDSNGGGWMVWEQSGAFGSRRASEIMVSRQQDDGWSAPLPVTSDPPAWNHAPSLAIDGRDRVWVAWSRSTGTDDAVWVTRWDDGRWSSPEEISLPGVVSRFPSLASGPNGQIWAAWSGYVENNYELFVRQWDGAAWKAPVQLTHDSGAGMYDWAPCIAVGDGGSVWVAWPRHEAGGDDSIFVAHRAYGQWTVAERVSAPDGAPDDAVTLAIGPQGQPWIAWVGWDAARRRSNLVVTHRSNDGWTAEQQIPGAETAGAVHDPAIAIDGQGTVHLAWSAGRNIAYSRQTEAGWSAPLGIAAATRATPTFATLALDHAGRAIVAWSDAQGTLRASPLEAVRLQTLAPATTGPTITTMRPATVVGRLVAFGDSITYGGYNAPDTYPALLEQRIDDHVYPSEVINEGVPGEWTAEGLARLESTLNRWAPQYVLIMEGTNDITHYKSNTPTRVTVNLKSDMDLAKSLSVKGILDTIPPRSDDKGDETEETNYSIRGLANDHHYLLADQWTAISAYPNWQNYLQYFVHPYGPLMEVVANTWYDTFLTLSWINEDTVPPSSTVVALPATSEGPVINVSWAGTDTGNAGSNQLGTGISVYDLQVRDGPSGSWSDWLTNTSAVAGDFTGQYGHTYYFRSRAQDRAGNWESYAGDQADTYTTVTDNTPPNSNVLPLSPFKQTAFTVQWSGSDSLSGIAGYDVQYRVGPGGTWQDWLTNTTATQATFGPLSPVSLAGNQTYYFRVRARDNASNVETYPTGDGDTHTTIAEYGFSGHVYGNRGLPLFGADVEASGDALNVGTSDYDGYYEVYTASSGDYIVTPTQDYAGELPALPAITVSSIVTGVDFVMPPLQNDVSNGGFEAGLTGWLASGVISPVVTTTAHSGQFALWLGAGSGAGDSSASQSPWRPQDLTDPTLSFLYRSAGAGPGDLSVALIGDTDQVTYTLPLTATNWTHRWFDLSGFDGQNLTIRFSLRREESADPLQAWIDEVSLGPAMAGPSRLYLPVVIR